MTNIIYSAPNDYRNYLRHSYEERENALYHYGVKGMKWGRRKKPEAYSTGTVAKRKKLSIERRKKIAKYALGAAAVGAGAGALYYSGYGHKAIEKLRPYMKKVDNARYKAALRRTGKEDQINKAKSLGDRDYWSKKLQDSQNKIYGLNGQKSLTGRDLEREKNRYSNLYKQFDLVNKDYLLRRKYSDEGRALRRNIRAAVAQNRRNIRIERRRNK